jgi:hypothetical protein
MESKMVFHKNQDATHPAHFCSRKLQLALFCNFVGQFFWKYVLELNKIYLLCKWVKFVSQVKIDFLWFGSGLLLAFPLRTRAIA